jgi:hypothetical protein
MDARRSIRQSRSMGSDGPRRATYADVLAAPPTMVAELVGGVLYTQPRPAIRHTHAALRWAWSSVPRSREAEEAPAAG